MQLEPASPSPAGFGLFATATVSWPYAADSWGSAAFRSWAPIVSPSRDTGGNQPGANDPGANDPETNDPEAKDAASGSGEGRTAEGAGTEDIELVRRCQAGEERAFELLFLSHRKQVTGLVYRMLGPSPELEDLVQDVFIQVLRSLGTFRDEARFSTWLYRVALNVVLMHRRAAGRRPRWVDEQHAAPAVDAGPSAHDTLETRRRVAAFYALLERLSEKKRAVFVLHELEGLTPARIAEIVHAPVLTVRTRLFYARRELARWIEEDPLLAELGAAQPAARAEAEGGEEEA
jgi:RNA polymerase sigma-70 factor (ECF subfamily)